MNLLEGTRRVQVVDKRITLAGAALVLLGSVLVLVLATISGATSQQRFIEPSAGMVVALLGLWLLLLGGFVWIGGWIVQGFVTPKDSFELSPTKSEPPVSRR